MLENDLSSGTILNTTNYWFIQNNTIMSNSSLGTYNELSKNSDKCEDSNSNILIIDSSNKKFSRSSQLNSQISEIPTEEASVYSSRNAGKRKEGVLYRIKKKSGSEAVGTNQECYIIIKLGGKRMDAFLPLDTLKISCEAHLLRQKMGRFGDPSLFSRSPST